ncbi:MAG: nitrous oxide reductase accessory protein NosL [Gammaproteobacteria bacterium]|nr:nitrous oxide reductase accessory protein NosL [Gammaproteobacteria bacterium]
MTTRRRVLGTLVALPALALAGPAATPAPGPRDTCPVCGMFVARYPEWVATVLWRDGHAAHFDGAKDLFKYLLDLGKYAPGRAGDGIATVAVTEYYAVARIDARDAWYVIGSDVLGPMGHELIPLATRADAEEYLRDHKGRRILRYEEVDRALLERLDQGRFD